MTRDDVYWWREAPPTSLPQRPVEPTCDVAVIGAGYTGLSAAITLARAGRSVLVFDKLRPGEGASTRNGGITSGNLRPSRQELTARFGAARAEAIIAESKAAREDLYRFVAEEGIDCDLVRVGRFTGAASPAHYERIAREAETLHRTLGVEAYPVPRAEQGNYLGTRFYHGGAVRMDIGGIHPAKLHAGMLRVALAAGVSIHGETPVTRVEATGPDYRITTPRGATVARDVITAVNGYADRSDRWLRRRLVPVRSRILATAPLSPNLMGELMPRRMMISETRQLHYYYRPSPDGTRILFGGRDGTLAGDAKWPIAQLRRAMLDIFPVLAGTELDTSWFGYVAMSRDMIPRIFGHGGKRYAVGYCGSGTVWARWAGQKAALQILGEPEGASALDIMRPPKPVPLYGGTPWFMPAYYAWLSAKDWLARRGAEAAAPKPE